MVKLLCIHNRSGPVFLDTLYIPQTEISQLLKIKKKQLQHTTAKALGNNNGRQKCT